MRFVVFISALGLLSVPGAFRVESVEAQTVSQAPMGELSFPPPFDLAMAPDVPADRPVGLTLAVLEQMALQNNPTLSQSRAAVQAARGVWQQVGLYPNPVAGYAAEDMGDNGTAGKQGGFVGQEFVTGGKLRLNRQVACREIMRLEQELAAQQFRVLTDVRTGFYDVLVAQRTIELADRLVKIAEQGVQAAEALLKAKEASRVDLLQARVEGNIARILLENARNRHQGAWRRLAAVLGMPDMAAERLAGDVEAIGLPLRWEDALARVLSESPELAAAAAEVQAARWATQRARVEWVPNVGVQATVAHDNASGDDIAGVQVALPLPLFDRNQGNIVAADSQLVAAQRNVERVRLSLQSRLAEVFRQYADAGQQVEKYRATILPDAKETLDLVASGYRQGEFSYLNLLTAQRTYFQSNLAYLESLLQLKSAQARIEGLLLNESLNGSSEEPGKP
jgi:cobalt-zinc-cadmium efflux system outer membrane protein